MEKLEFKFTITKDKFKILKQDKRITNNFLETLPNFVFKDWTFRLNSCSCPQIGCDTIFLKGCETSMFEADLDSSPSIITNNISQFRKALKEYTETYFIMLSVQEQLKERIKYFI